MRPAGQVSIHATLAGGDVQVIFFVLHVVVFLSTPPSRVATLLLASDISRIEGFYPRHPRGWRLRVKADPLETFEHVSIHATLAGGDLMV